MDEEFDAFSFENDYDYEGMNRMLERTYNIQTGRKVDG